MALCVSRHYYGRDWGMRYRNTWLSGRAVVRLSSRGSTGCSMLLLSSAILGWKMESIWDKGKKGITFWKNDQFICWIFALFLPLNEIELNKTELKWLCLHWLLPIFSSKKGGHGVNNMCLINSCVVTRYCKDIAKIFLQEEGIKQTIHLKKRNHVIECADRQVTPQPLLPSNQRKLMMLPYFLYKAGDYDDVKEILKTEVLCNHKWLLCKLQGMNKAHHSKYFWSELQGHIKLSAVSDTQLVMVTKSCMKYKFSWLISSQELSFLWLI